MMLTSKLRIGFGAAVAAAATLMLGGAAWAAGDTQAAWQGYATTTASTAQCAGIGGTGVGDTHVSIFRPHIAALDTQTFLSMMHLRAAITFDNTSEATIHQMHGAGNYTGYGVNSRAKGFSYTGGTYSLTVSPASIVASTPIINITGTLNNYFNTAGCSVTFKGVYVKRID
jgi:hypothetical protein